MRRIKLAAFLISLGLKMISLGIDSRSAITSPYKIKKLSEVSLSQKDVILEEPFAFIVKGETAYVMDRKATDIKIYHKSGKLIGVFGRKGQGPDEFLNPVALASWGNILMIHDMKKGKLLFYRIKPGARLQFYNSVKFYDFALHFKFLNSEELLIAGHSQAKNKNKTFCVFKFNLRRNIYEYILPSFVCYRVKDEKEYERKFVEELRILSPESYVDTCQGEIYYVPAIDFYILKRDRRGNLKFFGRKSEKFKKPHITHKIKKALEQRQLTKLQDLLNKFSYVEGLFCTKEGDLLLIFSSPSKTGRDVYFQIYNKEGQFIKEGKILHTPAETESEILTYFEEGNNNLYILFPEDEEFKLTKFKVEKIMDNGFDDEADRIRIKIYKYVK